MTYMELEADHMRLRASLIEANKFSTELAFKLATCGQLLGFTPDQPAKEIAAMVKMRMRVL